MCSCSDCLIAAWGVHRLLLPADRRLRVLAHYRGRDVVPLPWRVTVAQLDADPVALLEPTPEDTDGVPVRLVAVEDVRPAALEVWLLGLAVPIEDAHAHVRIRLTQQLLPAEAPGGCRCAGIAHRYDGRRQPNTEDRCRRRQLKTASSAAFCVQLRSAFGNLRSAFSSLRPAFSCVRVQLRSAFRILRSAFRTCVLRSRASCVQLRSESCVQMTCPCSQRSIRSNGPSRRSRHPLPACAVCSPKQRGNGPHRAAPAVRLAFSVLRSGTCVLRAGTCVLRSDPAFCVQLRSAFSCVQNRAFSCVLRSPAF
eukprot:gene8569-biopygen11461